MCYDIVCITIQLFIMKRLLVLLLLPLISCLESGDNNDKTSFAPESAQSERAMMKQDMSAEFRTASFSENNDDLSNNQAVDHEVSSKMLIKNGSMEIEVKSINDAKKNLDDLISKFGAYYSSEVINKIDYRYDFNAVIRVRSDDFDKFVNELATLGGTVTRQDINTNDVTAEYVDLKIRLDNKTAYLEKYREILKQAKSIKDILEVEEKIRYIEEELESVKGRMKFLNDQVNLSTLKLNLYQINETKMKPAEGFFSRLWSSIKKGWTALSEFVLILVMLWPFIIIGFAFFFFLFKWFKRPSKGANIKVAK